MSIIDVTTNQTYATISAAIAGSGAGDVIDIGAGAYSEYFPKLTHDLTLQSVGGLASFTTPGTPTNGQGILVIDANVTLSGLDLSGAAVPSGNGAGIRVETGSLTLIGSHIHNNQDGILVNAGTATTVSVTGSEIDHNGAGDGFTHNIYVGNIASLTIADSYIHDAIGGHEIKSRAQTTLITNNRIQDQAGNANYSIDLPDGGAATVTGNVLQKGPNTTNDFFVHFGGELYPSYSGSSLNLSGNSFIADTTSVTPYVLANATNSAANLSGSAAPATVSGNTLYGFPGGSPVIDLYGPADTLSANVFLPLSAVPPLNTTSLFAVPEPASALLLLLGFAAARAARRINTSPDRPRHRSAGSAP